MATQIKNIPEKYVGDIEVDAVRKAYENRGFWYYFLVKEGLDNGLSLNFARDALREAGEYLAANRFKNCKTIKEFADTFMTFGVKKVNEGEITKLTDNEMEVKLGYCPLITAWQKLTDDVEYIGELCDVCMDMDRGIAKGKNMEFELKGTIAKGDPKCVFRFKMK